MLRADAVALAPVARRRSIHLNIRRFVFVTQINIFAVRPLESLKNSMRDASE